MSTSPFEPNYVSSRYHAHVGMFFHYRILSYVTGNYLLLVQLTLLSKHLFVGEYIIIISAYMFFLLVMLINAYFLQSILN